MGVLIIFPAINILILVIALKNTERGFKGLYKYIAVMNKIEEYFNLDKPVSSKVFKCDEYLLDEKWALIEYKNKSRKYRSSDFVNRNLCNKKSTKSNLQWFFRILLACVVGELSFFLFGTIL